MTDPAPLNGRDFGSVADSYDRGRPTYPHEAVEWLIGPTPLRVVELGAGTGKLTEVLVELGHDVFATDPDERMLDLLSAKLPDLRATVGTAEQIPASDASADIVVAGQAYHWFDPETALPEIARVLKPGGRLALAWNERDERIPWVRRLGRLLDKPARTADDLTLPEIPASSLFSAVESAEFKFWQTINRETVQDLVLSRSNLVAMGDAEREAKRAEVLAFYDDYGRGMDGMQLPYVCRAFRSVVLDRPRSTPVPAAPVGPPPTAAPVTRPHMSDTAHRLPRVVTDGPADDGGSDDLILIDFR